MDDCYLMPMKNSRERVFPNYTRNRATINEKYMH